MRALALALALFALPAAAQGLGGPGLASGSFSATLLGPGATGVDLTLSGNMTVVVQAKYCLNVGCTAYVTTDGSNNMLFGLSNATYMSINNASGLVTSVAGGFGLVSAAAFFTIATKAIINTAPTISSGFGTSPSIVSSNGSLSFQVNVGTGGVATSGVVGLPAATTGWVCDCRDLTTPGANITRQTANSTTSCTVTNVAMSTGSAAAWTASDKLWCTATAN